VASLCDFPETYYCVQVSVAEVLRQARARGPLQMLAQRLKWRALDGQRVLTVSHGIQKEIENLSFISPASMRTIHNPIDIDKIQRQALHELAGIPQGPYVLHAGRAARQKRLDVLFEAFRHVAPPVKLVMLTNHPDRVARLAATFGLADRVVVEPFQQNPYAWMARARLLVLSSDFEGMSMVAMEALACGTPVVSTDCPHGMDEILTGELRRWLVPVGNGRELGARINEALQTPIDASAAEVLRKVDVRVIAQQYVELVSSGKAA
jgi:glycosyltransferase involved in cell wall biosynthesis